MQSNRPGVAYVGGVGRSSVTPEMVRDAVEELEHRRHRVPLAMLSTHLQRFYPVERDAKMLEKEILEQAQKAVKFGWIRRFADNSFQLSSLLWQSSVDEFGMD